MLLPFSSEFISLTQVDLAATSLLLIPFSKSLRAQHFSCNVLWLYLPFPSTNMFKYEQWAEKQMIAYGNVRIHNINKIELLNVQTLKKQMQMS